MADTATPASRKIIFADFSAVQFNNVVMWLKKDNVTSETVTSPEKFVARITEENFDACVVNLLLGGTGPFQLIRNVRASTKNGDIKIIVVSRQVHKMNIQNTMQAGANDFVGEPFEPENLYNRILYHLTPKTVIQTTNYTTPPVLSGDTNEYVSLLLEATELLSVAEREKQAEAIQKILQSVAKLLKSNRTSLIIVDYVNNAGVVLGSSDDPKFRHFPISLNKYPEILHVIHTGSVVLVEDVSQNKLTNQINEQVRTIKIGSLMVFPVRFNGDVVGVLAIRRQEVTEAPAPQVMRVIQGLANTLGAHSNLEASLRKIYKDYPGPKKAAA